MSTVTRAIEIVLFEPLVDVEVDFFDDLPVASSSVVVLVAPLCRVVHGMAARHLYFCGSRSRVSQADVRVASGRVERRGIVGHGASAACAPYEKSVRVTGAVYPSAAVPFGGLSVFWTL